MRNRLTPEKMPDVSSGPCSRFPSIFACSTVEDVTLAEVESHKQEMLTSSSYSHKTKDRTHFVIVRQTVLCLVPCRCAATTCTPEGLNGIGHLLFKYVCTGPAPHECGRASTPQNAEMMFSQSDGLVPELFASEASAWHAQTWHHKA